MRSLLLGCPMGLLLCFFPAPGRSADVTQEYDKKIKGAQEIGVLGHDLAGDSINYYTGATNFSVLDVGLPGNAGLPVAIGRH
jgi:hypothetical protein